MSRATLKKSLGEAGAFQDDSHGEDRLYKVLKALAEAGAPASAILATPATGVLMAMVVDTPSRLGTFWANLGTTGSAGTLTAQVEVNGTPITGSAVSISNTDADGTSAGIDLTTLTGAELAQGDLVEVRVTAVGTASANLAASLRLTPVLVEA